MKVTVVGAGYVGLVTGSCLADLGFRVLCLDSNPARVAQLQAGGVPIYEPGLDAVIARNRAAGRLDFTSDVAQAVSHGQILMIAVGTPPQEDGSADLQHVLAVARSIGEHMQDFKLVLNKSTVPVGTADRVRAVIAQALQARGLDALGFDVASNPEFLKEGAAIDDFMHPDRIVVGIDPGPHEAHSRRLMTQLYASFNRHHARTVWMDVRSAELTKYAANAMLAARISFMNEVANLADRLGADVDHVRRGIGADSRIGPSFLYAGCGYGGSCFPKDTRALISTAAEQGLPMQVVAATEAVNEGQKRLLVQRTQAFLGQDLTGRVIAVWGLAFKPNTDDMREASSRVIVAELLRLGARVQAYDPVAGHEALAALREDLMDAPGALDRLQLVEHDVQALDGADALLVVTEWKHFHNPDFEALRQRMRQPLIIDGRNLYEPALLQDLGIAYHGIGRRNALAQAALAARAQA